MAEARLQDKEEYDVVRKGLYLAKVEDVTVEESDLYKNKDGSPQVNWVFKFEIKDDPEFGGRFVWGRTPPWFNTSAQCKLRKWVQEIMGVDILPVDFNLNSDVDLVGKDVQIWVDMTTTGKAKVVDLLAAKAGPNTSSVGWQGAQAGTQSVPATAYAEGDAEFGEEPF